jgi:hypothetical protein
MRATPTIIPYPTNQSVRRCTDAKLDATVARNGGLYIFAPLSRKARAWVRKHVALSDWQWSGPTFVLDDGGMAYNLYRGMLDAGLTVGDG